MNRLKQGEERRDAITLTLSPKVKKAGAKVAILKNLSLSRLVENLIIEDYEKAKRDGILIESSK